MQRLGFSTFFILLLLTACGKADSRSFTEDFEKGKKDAYAQGIVSLSSGKWIFSDALLGGLDADKKQGAASARIRNNGFIAMDFDIECAIRSINVAHASYGNDKAVNWQLQYSEDRGRTWAKAGETVRTTGSLNTNAFAIDHTKGSIRFRIQNMGGGRLNIDDITTDAAVPPAVDAPQKRENNMAPGNPSNANKASGNYLIQKPQYSLSYNGQTGTANWLSWHLSAAWKGDEPRCNCFSPDNTLPAGFVRALPSDYSRTGFDKGHLCPSDDRDGSHEDNAATFLMTNIAPQAPNLNRDVWEKLESYCRKLVAQGNELYIIAGCYGSGAKGEQGYAGKIAGKITVPARFWKVILVLPEGENDLGRINRDTRLIAVDMPNEQSVNTYSWSHYRTSVDAIEKATGYDLLSAIPAEIQQVLESRIDKAESR
jgi:endonuclease G